MSPPLAPSACSKGREGGCINMEGNSRWGKERESKWEREGRRWRQKKKKGLVEHQKEALRFLTSKKPCKVSLCKYSQRGHCKDIAKRLNLFAKLTFSTLSTDLWIFCFTILSSSLPCCKILAGERRKKDRRRRKQTVQTFTLDDSSGFYLVVISQKSPLHLANIIHLSPCSVLFQDILLMQGWS